MASVLKKGLQLKQWTSEKIGKGQKTELSDDFRRLSQETDVRKEYTLKVYDSLEQHMKTLSKKKELDKEKLLPIQALGLNMATLGQTLPHDSIYGQVLEVCGGTHETLAKLQDDYVSGIRDTYHESLSRFSHECQQHTALLKKLENRRLDYDARLSKVQKSKKEKPEWEEDMRNAQSKYEDTLREVTQKMVAVNESEAGQLTELFHFMDAETEYFERSLEAMRALQTRLAPLRSISETGSSLQSSIHSDKRRAPVAGLYIPPSTTLEDSVPRSSRSLNALNSTESKFAAMTMSQGGSMILPPPTLQQPNGAAPHARAPAPSPAQTPYLAAPAPPHVAPTPSPAQTPYLAAPAPPHVAPTPSHVVHAPALSAVPPPFAPSAKKFTKQVRALYDFDAECDGEISMHKGAIINVYGEVSEGWWEGSYCDANGNLLEGMFPSVYTEVIQTFAPASAPAPKHAPLVRPTRAHSSPGAGTNVMPMPTAAGPDISAVPQCGACGCNTFTPDLFRKGRCTACHHKHV